MWHNIHIAQNMWQHIWLFYRLAICGNICYICINARATAQAAQREPTGQASQITPGGDTVELIEVIALLSLIADIIYYVIEAKKK